MSIPARGCAPIGSDADRAMNEEGLLVAALLGGAVALCVGIVVAQRRAERRLAAQTDIELSLESTGRTVAVLLPAALAMPVLVGVVGAVTDPWMRAHALGAVLASVGGSALSIVGALRATRHLRQIGTLRWTSDRLELRVGGVVNSVDLARPFILSEASAFASQGIALQIVVVTQDDRTWAFGYTVGIKNPARGEVIDAGRCPLFGVGSRVIHDRLRDASMRPEPSTRVPSSAVVTEVR